MGKSSIYNPGVDAVEHPSRVACAIPSRFFVELKNALSIKVDNDACVFLSYHKEWLYWLFGVVPATSILLVCDMTDGWGITSSVWGLHRNRCKRAHIPCERSKSKAKRCLLLHWAASGAWPKMSVSLRRLLLFYLLSLEIIAHPPTHAPTKTNKLFLIGTNQYDDDSATLCNVHLNHIW